MGLTNSIDSIQNLIQEIDHNPSLLEKNQLKKRLQEILSTIEEEDNCAISWSVNDFEARARRLELLEAGVDEEEMEDYLNGNEPTTLLIPNHWKLFDRALFPKSVCEMVQKHDAEVGITWDTVDYFLHECCRTNH